VADDSGFGGGTMQYQVLLDPAKIAGVGLSVPQVESRAGGQQRQRRRRILFARRPVLLRARPRPHGTLEDIGNVVLAVHNGTPVLLKDVGRVVIGIAPRLGEFGFEKQDDAVEGVILMRTGEKTQDVLKRVEAKTKELNEQVLPKDVKVVPFYDRTD
jgi:cobalt-zinc-cadmium resistance protein CzcA